MKKKRTANQWVKEIYFDKINIINPLGWEHADVSLDTPITEDEFEQYLSESTVTGLIEAKNEIKLQHDKKHPHAPELTVTPTEEKPKKSKK